MDFSVAGIFTQTFFDASGGVLPGRIEVAQMIDVTRLADLLMNEPLECRKVIEEYRARPSVARQTFCYGKDHARERVFLQPDLDVGVQVPPESFAVGFSGVF